MSTSTVKRPLARAREDAEAFRRLFPDSCFVASQWHFAGSLRRGRANVGDVEHVVVPCTGDIELTGGLFAETETVNLLLHRLDELVRTYQVSKHLYGGDKPGTTASPRWGERYRGCDYRGFCHEVFTADEHNLGSVLAIRTGPGGYSKMLVQLLTKQGYWQNGGYVWNRRTLRCECGWAEGWVHADFERPKPGDPKPRFAIGDGKAVLCPRCGRGDQIHMARVSVPDERVYFRLCGIDWVEPSRRFDPEERK